MLNINEFVKEVGENAVAHGWWDGEQRSFGELIALCHSELSEALEEYRAGTAPAETYYSCSECDQKCGCTGRYFNCVHKPGISMRGKPEGIPSELADVVIRICDMCHHYGINLETILMEKHEYNKSRPYRHGGKVI